jgi:choline dehydrogenase-like flavoprotein
MFVDARSVPAGTVIEADLCIVGAGAAGITIAREFAASGLRVALMEGGAMEFEPDSQDLYAGESIGQPYWGLSTYRLRYFGGTTNHWAGWCLPLDPIDFEAREGLPYHGWPFD